jgi:hypothetical protein
VSARLARVTYTPIPWYLEMRLDGLMFAVRQVAQTLKEEAP